MQENQRDTTGALAVHFAPRAIRQVIDFALDSYHQDEGIENGYPSGAYHTLLWSFVREIKSHFSEEANPQDVFFDHVHPEIESRGGWESIFECYWDVEVICMEFICNWDAVRYRIGESPLENATEKAEAKPLRPERCKRHPGKMPKYGRFVSIAGWLQVSMGNRPILLPVDKLAEILEVAAKSVSRYRQLAEADGYLRIEKQHERKHGRATEFLFDVSRFNCLLEAAQRGTQDRFDGYTGPTESLWWDRRCLTEGKN